MQPKAAEMDGQRLQGLIDGNKRWLETRRKDPSVYPSVNMLTHTTTYNGAWFSLVHFFNRLSSDLCSRVIGPPQLWVDWSSWAWTTTTRLKCTITKGGGRSYIRSKDQHKQIKLYCYWKRAKDRGGFLKFTFNAGIPLALVQGVTRGTPSTMCGPKERPGPELGFLYNQIYISDFCKKYF